MKTLPVCIPFTGQTIPLQNQNNEMKRWDVGVRTCVSWSYYAVDVAKSPPGTESSLEAHSSHIMLSESSSTSACRIKTHN